MICVTMLSLFHVPIPLILLLFISGYNEGAVSGMLANKHFPRPLDLQLDSELLVFCLIASSYPLGGLIGAIAAVCNPLLRKTGVITACVTLTAIGVLISATSSHIAQMIIGRLLTGTGIGYNVTLVQRYIIGLESKKTSEEDLLEKELARPCSTHENKAEKHDLESKLAEARKRRAESMQTNKLQLVQFIPLLGFSFIHVFNLLFSYVDSSAAWWTPLLLQAPLIIVLIYFLLKHDFAWAKELIIMHPASGNKIRLKKLLSFTTHLVSYHLGGFGVSACFLPWALSQIFGLQIDEAIGVPLLGALFSLIGLLTIPWLYRYRTEREIGKLAEYIGFGLTLVCLGLATLFAYKSSSAAVPKASLWAPLALIWSLLSFCGTALESRALWARLLGSHEPQVHVILAILLGWVFNTLLVQFAPLGLAALGWKFLLIWTCVHPVLKFVHVILRNLK